MNIHDRSSLLLVPSGYKDGKLYSQVPSSGDGDFAFTRGSNLAATRVGADGLIEKGRENLLLQSNTFSDIAWADLYTAYTRTGGQAGYDGSNDAWELSKASASNGYITQAAAATNSVYTFSIHAKSGSQNGLILFFGTPVLSVNLDTGENFGLNRSIINSSITSVGNGWWKIEFTFLASGTDISLKIMDADTNTNVAGSIYVQDAQLELGLAATDYIESGATTGKAGILENQPRLDYSGGASRASLLLEPQRVNLIGYSEYYGSNLLVNSSIETNNTTSPEGVQNATLLKEDTNSGNHALREPSNTSIAADDSQYVISFYAKSNGRNIRFIDDAYAGSQTVVNFNLSSGGTFSNGSLVIDADAVAIGTDGWYRCYAVIDKASAAQSSFRFSLRLLGGASNDNDSYTGDGTSGVWIYGKEVNDAVSYPTSYIPTYGTSVTRAQDSGQLDPLDRTYGDDSTWFFELERIPGDDELNQTLTIITNSLTGVNNRFTINSTSTGRIRFLIYDNSGTSENLYTANDSFVRGTPIKIALKLNATGASVFVNGASPITSSTLGAITGINRVNTIADTILKQFIAFPTALSDTDCELLTGTTYESFAAMAEALNYTVYE